jgi:hypothetical protein
VVAPGRAEDVAMAALLHMQSWLVGDTQARTRFGHESGGAGSGVVANVSFEGAEYRGRSVELAEPAREAGVGDKVAPALADEAGADEASWAAWRETEQDLFDDLVHQMRRRRRRHAADRQCASQPQREERCGSASARWVQSSSALITGC